MRAKRNKNVLIAMSGGIDSSVAAFLLREKGFQVKGVYFQFFDDQEGWQIPHHHKTGDVSFSSGILVREAVDKLGFSLEQIDYRKEFKEMIINDFIRKYQMGMTPNPCISCNEKIKFKLLSDLAQKNRFQFIATGHYARIKKDRETRKYLLKRGMDFRKEQSYFLYRLNQNTLSKLIFPLGDLMKKDVKRIACEIGLNPSKTKESQEICFLAGENYRKLIEKSPGRRDKPGFFLDTSGKVLGKHKGIAFYTIGQRRKIGLSLNRRKYIVQINPSDNTIMIGDEADLYRKEFTVEHVHYIAANPITEPLRLEVQIRYNAPPVSVTVFPHQKVNQLFIKLDEPQRAITPGQSAVFYRRDTVFCGGIISFF